MRLHPSVIQTLLRYYELHGGRKDNSKLMQELAKLDLSPYTQKENPKQKTFLVLTEQLKKPLK